MTTDEHRDDLRIAQALSPIERLDLGPEPGLGAPSTGRVRSRTRTHRRGLFAGFAVAGALAVAIVAVVLHTPGQKLTVAKGTLDQQLAAAIIGSWDVADAHGVS